MATTLSAGLAWAMPVDPSKLGPHLETFARVLPELHALRLCHRFGKGPAVHLTKLPAEIEQIIEDMLLGSARMHLQYRKGSGWKTDFQCFQSTCAPSDHCGEMMSPMLDAVEGSINICKSCLTSSVFSPGCTNGCQEQTSTRCDACAVKLNPKHCENSCRGQFEDRLDTLCMNSEYAWEIHNGRQESWRRRIDQSKGGKFVKYDKLLQRYFGLEVFLAEARIDGEDASVWPSRGRYGFLGDVYRTTLCYLTLPKSFGPKGSYAPSEVEENFEDYAIPCAQAMPVKLPKIEDMEANRGRFQRALRMLGLRATVHPSQRTTRQVSAYTDYHTDVEMSGMSSEGDENGISKEQWPQLMLLTKCE